MIWLRGISPEKAQQAEIRLLPSVQTYHMDEKGHLFPLGSLTPSRKLPPLLWEPIQSFVPLDIPDSAIPGKIEEAFVPEIVPSESEKEASALLTSMKDWLHFAERTSAIRLEKLLFAVSADQQVFIIGNPLPPIPGKAYWRDLDLLLPCGYNWAYPILTYSIQQHLNPEQQRILVFDHQAEWIGIDKQSFKQASRSAVRLSAAPQNPS